MLTVEATLGTTGRLPRRLRSAEATVQIRPTARHSHASLPRRALVFDSAPSVLFALLAWLKKQGL
jgi:hypothetical protein